MGKIARGVSIVFLSQVVRMGAKGALILILTRYLLQPAEYGLLFLTLSVLSFVLLFSTIGLGKAGGKYVAEYNETSPELIPIVIRSALFYRCIAIITTCVAIYAYRDWVAMITGEPLIAPLLLVGTGYVAVKSLYEFCVMMFQGFNRMDLVALCRIVSNVLILVMVPTLIILEFGLEGALFGYILATGTAATIGIGIISVRYYERHDVSREVRKAVSRRVLRYSVPLTLTKSAGVINGRVDTIMLSVFRGPIAIAFYTLGKQIVDFLIAPAYSLGFGISPAIGEQKANDDLRLAARLYERSFTYTVALYGPAAAGVVLVASPTIRLIFGTNYIGAVPVLQIFSIYVILRAVDAITGDALDYLGRARSRAIAKGIVAVGNVLLNLLLIPPFGIVGAAVATVITYGVYVGAELYIVADELPIQTGQLVSSSLVVGAITVGMSGVVYPLTGYVSDIPTLVGVVCAGGLVWLVLTELSGVVDLRRLSSALI